MGKLNAKMATFRQELPPAGGFQRIEWKKQPSFKKVNGFRLLALALAVKAGGYYMYLRDCAKRSERELEQNDARIAISPFILAESDRGYMKFLRSTREEEEVLMKDVPNWRPGMLYDEPIYYTRNPDDLRVVHR